MVGYDSITLYFSAAGVARTTVIAHAAAATATTTATSAAATATNAGRTTGIAMRWFLAATAIRMGIHASGDGRSVWDAAWTLAVPRSQSPRARFHDPWWKRACNNRWDGEDCTACLAENASPKCRGKCRGKDGGAPPPARENHARHTSRDDSGLFCWLTWLVRVPGDTLICATICCGWERHNPHVCLVHRRKQSRGCASASYHRPARAVRAC